jgi:sugar lactone lactonase YvrE
MGRVRAIQIISLLVFAGLSGPMVRLAAFQEPQPGTITTVAGNGKIGYAGDGGPAVEAEFNAPTGLAVDGEGNLFITDTDNHRVRKVGVNGIVTTVAGSGPVGSGKGGFSGDNGPATDARFSNPYGLAVDGEGNLFIGDVGNSRIRKIGVNGVVTTVAGNGKFAYSGDGGPAILASINGPASLAAGTMGDLFFADAFNTRVRKVSSDGTISTVAGGGKPLDGLGDGGPATQARLKLPTSIALDAMGNLFIADFGNNRVRKVDTKGIITTLAGTGEEGFSGDGGPATEARFNRANRLAVDPAGNLFISDTLNFRVRKVSPSGIVTTVVGTGEAGFSGDGGPAAQARLDAPYFLAIDRTGNLFIGDILREDRNNNITIRNNRVRRVFGVAVPG